MAGFGRARIGLTSVLATVGVALVIAACGSSSSNTSAPAAGAASPSNSTGTVAISAAKASGGMYLTGASGRSVYLWVADRNDKSVCSGACAQTWPPVITKGSPTAGTNVQASDLGTTVRAGGVKQVTYNGHPLYYYAGDTHSGQFTGQGSDQFGAKWWLIAPTGTAITSGSSSSSGGGGSSW